ncbi:cation diffusion facilitator family transporter [Geomonas paludis]|uniref:Cation diffusion facilitator family transporter n=1 Tax=Geomonas paludis TaxID=2740185 RepID=A0A6V8MYJ3_9BACT|nr:cation diffusion facilitator family transporter [Geomonas paludis]UPU36530.1 cation diffusion facilitator family transporter [Geomonas paludis]GFO65288.1 cation transporter [Geomonas paludis]
MHAHADSHLDQSITGRFKYAILLTSLTLVAELVGGIWTNSLALLSDAAHVFLDLFALLLSLGAIKLASYPVSDTRTFGWHRTEVFASFINGSTVFLIAGIICYEAVERMLQPQAVKSLEMLIIAAVGLVMNLLSAGALHSHSHDDLNVHSAFLHVIGDAAASVGVIVGGIIMYFTDWYLLDAIISVGIGFIIFWGSWRVMRESVHILLEGVPRGIDINQVAFSMREVEGVEDVHHLNIWTICSHIIALSAHVVVPDGSPSEQSAILRKIEEKLFQHFHISHTTLQVENAPCTEVAGVKQFRHRPRAAALAHAHAHPHHHPHGTCQGHHHCHDDHTH